MLHTHARILNDSPAGLSMVSVLHVRIHAAHTRCTDVLRLKGGSISADAHTIRSCKDKRGTKTQPHTQLQL